MKPSKDRDAYIVLAPTGKSKIYSVACRKIGSRDRYSVIATCQNEVNADSIVDGLKLLQGEVVKVETSMHGAVESMREQVSKERRLHTETRQKLSDAQHQKRMADDQVRTLTLQRDAAQKKAREEPTHYMTSEPT